MAKFVIQCPHCGVYNEASDGFFSKKKFPCKGCGAEINIKYDSFAHIKCPECEQEVVYDQRKGDVFQCPVCKKTVSGHQNKTMSVNFTCPTCSCNLSASIPKDSFINDGHLVNKKDTFYQCPLCNTVINVAERMAKLKLKNEGVASVIKYEGDNTTFVWKHPVEDFNLGSQLIVHESQEALFFRDGRALDLFGSGRHTLVTQKLPLLENLYKLPTNTDEIFHSEVYFINMTTQTGIKWGTDSKVRFFDPASGIHVELGASGNFNIRVCDSRRLVLKLVGTTEGFGSSDTQLETSIAESGRNSVLISSITGKFRALVMNRVKSNLARIIKENNINVLEVDEKMGLLSEAMRVAINENLEEYGLTMPEFFITNIVLPEDDPNFRTLKQQFADRTLKVRQEEIKKAEAEAAMKRKLVEAQTEADLKRMKAQAEADAYRMKAFAEAEEMRAKGYTYQQETAREVGLAAMQNGITGGNGGQGSGVVGDVAGLGLAMGALGSVMGMTKDAFGNIAKDAKEAGQNVIPNNADGWTCECGREGITSKFCPDCGKPKPMAQDAWKCPGCGTEGITSKFCPNCGASKPVIVTWDCTNCGTKDITSKFCPNCGKPKPEEEKGWDCNCGTKGIKTGFCPNCGGKKPTDSVAPVEAAPTENTQNSLAQEEVTEKQNSLDPKANDTWDCSCGAKGIKGDFCPDCGAKKVTEEDDNV